MRWHELDSFQHLNHATYLSYLDHARWNTLEQLGVNLEQMRLWQNIPVVHSLEIRYILPAFAGDPLTIESEVADARKSSFIFRQKILRETDLIAQAEVRIAIVGPDGKPTRIHPELEKAFQG